MMDESNAKRACKDLNRSLYKVPQPFLIFYPLIFDAVLLTFDAILVEFLLCHL